MPLPLPLLRVLATLRSSLRYEARVLLRGQNTAKKLTDNSFSGMRLADEERPLLLTARPYVFLPPIGLGSDMFARKSNSEN